MTGLPALAADLYFWVGLVLFLLSLAGIFWILKSLQKEPEHQDPEPETESWGAPKISGSGLAARPSAGPANLETLAGQIALIEETLSTMEKRFSEQNIDQMNEMAGQMKLMVQMLKVIQGGGGGESVAMVNQKVDKIYKILSALSQTEQK